MTCVSFLKQHQLKLHLTNPIERPNCEIERHKEMVGILTDEVQVGLPEVAG
jgi:transposase-like protein